MDNEWGSLSYAQAFVGLILHIKRLFNFKDKEIELTWPRRKFATVVWTENEDGEMFDFGKMSGYIKEEIQDGIN